MKRFAIVAIVMFTGCATVGRPIDPAAVSRIQKGKSTQSDVISLLGAPTSSSTMGNNGQITFVYQFAHASANAATFVPVVGLFAGGATAQSQMVIVSFGADGLVQNVMQTGSNTDIRNGGVPAAIP